MSPEAEAAVRLACRVISQPFGELLTEDEVVEQVNGGTGWREVSRSAAAAHRTSMSLRQPGKPVRSWVPEE